MAVNAKSFNDALLRFWDQTTPQEFGDFTRAIGIEAGTRMIQRTPVDKGEHRSRWNAAPGDSPAPDVAPSGDASGQQAIDRVASAIKAAPNFANIHITNHGPAILVLEEGGFEPPDPGPSRDPRPGRKGRILVQGGYSVQAPHGMAAITLAELESFVARQTRHV